MEDLLAKIYKLYLPNKIVLVADPEKLPSLDLLKGKIAIEGKPTVYICKNNTCSLPLTDWGKIEKALLSAVEAIV